MTGRKYKYHEEHTAVPLGGRYKFISRHQIEKQNRNLILAINPSKT